ncbi:unnamed protein product [Cuscuta epithymum]|uniref:Uncharacterized protein n=1 Tax=Cuscuta epithymum TaxID=186058 RepID=A0AAV0FAH2_9ASTE|nr:unnamed protein product [Cuscuta epithymum]CAH9132479.1 unnamed protein product [Cuscuta epithymum]
MNDVIITNYIESSLSKLATLKVTARFSTRHDQRSQLSSDRRARILAYAQQLRHCNDNRSPERNTTINSRSKLHKKRRWPAKIKSSFDQIFQRHKVPRGYERILTEEYNDDNEYTPGEKVNKSKHRTSYFCVRFKALLKEFSCVGIFKQRRMQESPAGGVTV